MSKKSGVDSVLEEGRKQLGIKNKKVKTKEEDMKYFTKHKQTIEQLKTILIVAILVALGAFIGGMKYQQKYEANVETKAHAIAKQQAKVETSKPTN